MTARKATTRKPRTKAKAERHDWLRVVLPAARAIVADYAEAGTLVTLRQLLYRLVMGQVDHLTTADGDYKGLSTATAEARRRDAFPDLIDHTRQLHTSAGWPDPAAFLADVPAAYRLDRSRCQPTALWVAVEKDTLRTQVQGWLDGLGVHLAVCRGFTSQTYVDRVAAAIAERAPHHDRTVLFYVGDLDASGEAVEADLVARLEGRGVVLDHHERVALTKGQVDGPPVMPSAPAAGFRRDGTPKDTRWPAFAARYDLDPAHPVQWEVEGLDPAALRAMLLAAVEPFLDRGALAGAALAEADDRERMRRLLAGWPPPDLDTSGTDAEGEP